MNIETETETRVEIVIAPRYSAVTMAELLEGNTPKRSYILERRAAGAEKWEALAEYDTALAEKHRHNTGAAAALIGSGDFTVTRLKKMKSGGFSATFTDNRASKAKQAAAETARIEKLRAKLAAAEAKLAKLAK
jgi:hypothetical protein